MIARLFSHKHLFSTFAALLAIFVYFYGLGSDHIATNGDELVYAQIARATAENGHWLPLQSPIARLQNTKPPLLFWQGMISSDWAKNWTLWNLRYPSVIYTLLTAMMLVLLGKRLSKKWMVGLLTGLIFLSFFGTFRYGRCFLTSGPEVFWLFSPCFLLLYWPNLFKSWMIVPFLGVIVGIGLLYKSFALIIPVAAGLSWWYLCKRKYNFKSWIKHDIGKIILLSLVSLGVFSLWFFLDPNPQAIFHDFIVRENMGKFDAGAGSYLANFFFGASSIWRNVIAYPLNAGLLIPATIALFIFQLGSVFKFQIFLKKFATPDIDKIRNLNTDPNIEKLLWIWLISVFVIFSFPNQRDERYLLLGMPALALLLAINWERLPRWILALSLIAVAVIAGGLGSLGLLLEHHLASAIWGFYHYPLSYWLVIISTIFFALFGLWNPQLTRTFVCPGIILVYLCYACFLWPFDGSLGHFDEVARDAIRSKRIWVPINFNAREESYRFLLPENKALFPYDYKASITIAEMQTKVPRFIVSLPLTDTSIEDIQGARLLGRRLNLIDRFNAKETQAIIMGDIAKYLFHQDLLIEKN